MMSFLPWSTKPEDRYAEGSLVDTIDHTAKSSNESKIVYPAVKIEKKWGVIVIEIYQMAMI